VADLDPQLAGSAHGEDEHDEEMPRVQFTRRNLLVGGLFIVLTVAFLYVVLPQLADVEDTWHRIEDGDPWWLALAAACTVLSFLGYVAQFRGVFIHAEGKRTKIGFRESYEITMAGLAATRLFGAGGAGGIALTAWALRRSGMKRVDVADRTITFLALQYVFYFVALLVCGVGLWLGVFVGDAPFALTVVPAIFGGVCIVLGLLIALTPTDLQERLSGFASRHGRGAKVLRRLATLPATMSQGIRHAIGHLRDRDLSTAGSLAYWVFNIAILWAAFRAFGASPPYAVIVMGYFVGMLGNLLPLPGGVGGVDGGMIGAFVGFGVDFDQALVAVLTYRAFAFWLPTIPGAIAYLQLRRTVARWREERLAEAPRATAQPGTILSEA
jgi:uncharacterized protein (TIRG00374 family)